MLQALCLLIGLFAATPDMTPAAPVQSAMKAASPLILHQSSASRTAVLVSLINQARAEKGLRPLQWDDRLAKAATAHARLMSERGQLSHQFPGEPDLTGRLTPLLRLDQAGENVFYDSSVQSAHEAFMNSPNHRANILNDAYDAVGIGIIDIAGTLYIAENFAHRVPELGDTEAAVRVAKQFSDMRKSGGGSSLTFEADARAQQLACSMAQHESTDGKGGLTVPHVRFAAAYATTDPTQMPDSVAKLSGVNGLSHFTVGVCYARSPKYPTGLYWVSMLFFQRSALALR